MCGIDELEKANNPALQNTFVTVFTLGKEPNIFVPSGNTSQQNGKLLGKIIGDESKV